MTSESAASCNTTSSTTRKQLRQQLRQRLRRQRQQLTWHQRHACGLAASQQLARSNIWLRAKHIAIYWDDDGEVETLPLIRRAWAMKKSIYIPVLDVFDRMRFVPLLPNDKLAISKFGLQVPATRRKAIKPLALDLIIAPLVAFDRRGNRIGRGGGHYDRFLNRCKFGAQTSHYRKPYFLGLAYSFQCIDNIPGEPWDIPLDAALTENQLTDF